MNHYSAIIKATEEILNRKKSVMPQSEFSLLESLLRKISHIQQGEKGDKGDKGEKGDRGEKGDKGDSPIAGIDYPIPKDGSDGKDGVDGKDVSMEEILQIASREMKTHEKEFNHKNIHESKMIGEYEFDSNNAETGDYLVIKGKKIIAKKPKPEVKVDAPYGLSRGGLSNSQRYRIRTITETGGIDPSDNILHVDATNGNVTLRFYSASGNQGYHQYIKRIDNNLDNDVTFEMAGSETIDFETLYKLVNQGSGAEVYNDGQNFFIKHIS